ncbi:hypothetical protein Tco_0128365 [Tanacetum coccineum]
MLILSCRIRRIPQSPTRRYPVHLEAPPSPDYVPGPEEPKQAPLSPEFVPEPVYPEFMPPKDEVLPTEEQPLSDAVRSRGSDCDIPVVFSLVIALLRNKHSKAYRFYVIEPNDSVSINSIIESRDAIFDENRFSSIPRPNDIIPNSVESQRDDHSDDVPSEIPEPRKGKRVQKAKSYGSDFQLYLVEGSRDQVRSQYSYCYNIEEAPRMYNEAMKSRDATF